VGEREGRGEFLGSIYHYLCSYMFCTYVIIFMLSLKIEKQDFRKCMDSKLSLITQMLKPFKSWPKYFDRYYFSINDTFAVIQKIKGINSVTLN